MACARAKWLVLAWAWIWLCKPFCRLASHFVGLASHSVALAQAKNIKWLVLLLHSLGFGMQVLYGRSIKFDSTKFNYFGKTVADAVDDELESCSAGKPAGLGSQMNGLYLHALTQAKISVQTAQNTQRIRTPPPNLHDFLLR
ncbi:hypothetical protein C8R45DRAFT_923122 [Mycena sanguinolenta]|nr:hypothetical protein C8R45DRAFT_923122 [Mycena sanguinolenta]